MNSSTDPVPMVDRRAFLKATALAGAAALPAVRRVFAQVPGDRPARTGPVEVLGPGDRLPVSLIIDDSTCLVNLNKFAMPQFDATFGGSKAVYRRNWKEWPDEIPDDFIRKFADWCGGAGVKGKFSVVPYPACVGRLDRELPGWSPAELEASLDLVRTRMMPNWDIHPEMITHTRVIDLRTGQPYPDRSTQFMENWEWTTGRSTDEIADYIRYALGILRNVGLRCEGITTPGGFGNKALPQLAEASLRALRDVFQAEVPHYFRHMFTEGPESVAPRVEYASGLDGPDPRCVVSIIACAGDWTGGWDNTPPGGADKFITAGGDQGRLVDVIARGEPTCLLAHWTGVWFNGQEIGLKILQEVVGRLQARYDHLVWMKLAEIARYWAARELTRIDVMGDTVHLSAPFAAPAFTLRVPRHADRGLALDTGERTPLREVARRTDLAAGTWMPEGERALVCFNLPKGASRLRASLH